MENMIEIDGKLYTEDEIKEFTFELFEDLWDKMKRIIEINPVGCRRLINSDKLDYYKSISKGKSNNWLKQHGLPVRRRVCH